MKFGVYGVGRIGKVFVELLQQCGHEVLCIGDDVAAANNDAIAKLQFTGKTYLSPNDMIQHHPELEAVVIASHTKDHAKHAMPFINSQIPIYLEKPLTDDLAEAFAFVSTIGTSNKILQIGLQRRFDEALCYGKSLIDAGLLGKIREIRSVLRDQHAPPTTYSSKGLIIDMGIHVADEAIWLIDELPHQVWGKVYEAIDYHSPIDEGGNTAFVGFTTPAGIIGRLDLSRTHASGYNNETYIIGTQATLHIGRFNGYPGKIPVELWNQHGQLDPASTVFDMSYLDADTAEFLPRFKKAYIAALKDFEQAIKDQREFRVTQNDVLTAQLLVEAAHQSAQNHGREVIVEQIKSSFSG